MTTDSAIIQNVVQQITGIGTNAIPKPWGIFAPAITAVVTAITAFIIRFFEKKALVKQLTANQTTPKNESK